MEIEEPEEATLYLKVKPGGKKEKKKRFSNLIIAKRKKKAKTDMDIWTSAVLKNRLTDLSAIKSLLETKYSVSPSAGIQRVLRLIGETKVYNNKVVLSDNFANKPLYFYVNFLNYDMRTFTNDELFLVYTYKTIYDNIIKDEKMNEEQKKIIGFMGDSILMKCYFTSNSFTVEPGQYYSGYYQDYTTNLAVIGFNTLNEVDQQAARSENVFELAKEFTYNAVNYVVYKYKSCTVIFVKTDDVLNTIHSACDKIITFKKKAGCSLGVKEIKIKNINVRYVDMKIKPESFCPSFLTLNRDVRCNIVYKMKFDLNVLFAKLDDRYRKKGGFDFYYNSCYWDNIDTWYDFISIYAITSTALKTDDKNLLLEYVQTYMQLKPTIDIWKKLQLNLSKIYKDFYNSFNGYLKYSKLEAIAKRLDAYLHDYNVMLNEGTTFGDMVAFFKKTTIYNYSIYEQFGDHALVFPKHVAVILENLLSGKNVEGILDSLRACCQAIYKMSLSGGNQPYFLFVVSQGAFLGNLHGDEMSPNPLKDVIDGLYERTEEKELSEKEKSELMYNYYDQKEKYFKQVIENNVDQFITNNKDKITLNAESKKILVNSIYAKLSKEKTAIEALEKQIINCLMFDKSLNTVIIPEKDIVNCYNEYALTVKKDKLTTEIKTTAKKLDDIDKSLKSGGSVVPSSGGTSTVPVPIPMVDKPIEEGGKFVPVERSVSSGMSTVAAPPKRKREVVEIKTNTELGDFKIPVIEKKPEPMHVEESKPRVETEPKIEAKPEIKPKEEIKPEIKPKEEIKPEIKPETKPKVETKPKPKSKYKTPKPKEETKYETKPKGKLSVRDILKRGKEGRGVADLEKEIEEREKETDELLERHKKKKDDDDDDEDMKKFIVKDVPDDNYFKKKRKSFIVQVSDLKVYSNTVQLDGIYMSDEMLKKICEFYVELLQYLKETIPIDFFYNLIKDEYDKGNYPKCISYIAEYCPISNAFINELALNNPLFPNIRELKAYFRKNLKEKEGKVFNSFGVYLIPETFTNNSAVIHELMNMEYRNWPIYKEPSEAEEGLLDSEKKEMEKETNEPKGYDLYKDVKGYVAN